MEARLGDLERELMLIGRRSAIACVGGAGSNSCSLDRSAYVLLSRLEVQGPMSIGELADAFRLDNSTVHRQIGAMLRTDLVQRFQDPEGGIARKFDLTREGARKLAEDRELIRSGLGRVLDGWAPEDVANLTALLTRFNTSFEEREDRPWPRAENAAAAVGTAADTGE